MRQYHGRPCNSSMQGPAILGNAIQHLHARPARVTGMVLETGRDFAVGLRGDVLVAPLSTLCQLRVMTHREARVVSCLVHLLVSPDAYKFFKQAPYLLDMRKSSNWSVTLLSSGEAPSSTTERVPSASTTTSFSCC